jgi:hypothetical protein
MAALRIWFDLAGADVVLSDQRAVRRSIGKGFRHAWRSLGRLLGSYVATTVVAAVVLCAGLLTWMKFVPAAGVVRATLLGQLILLLLLIPRFWQRGIAVTYYLQNMVEPVAIVQSFTCVPARSTMSEASVAGSVVPDAPPTPAS